MNPVLAEVFMAVTADIGEVNLWGALGCAVTFSASLFAILDALGDYANARGKAGNAWQVAGTRLKVGSKLVAAGIASLAAGVVLALDNNWWALIALGVVFFGVIGWSMLALSRARVTGR